MASDSAAEASVLPGAPADCELREWQNSWQITAQAAEADLVLTECILFDEAWPAVVQTGECYWNVTALALR